MRRRLPVAYYVSEGATALAPVPGEILAYVLSDACEDRRVFPSMFSTAADLARFALMLLGGGTLDDKR